MVPIGRERKGLVQEPGRAAKEEPCNTAVPPPPPPLAPGTPPPLKPSVDSEENPTPPPTSMKEPAPGPSTIASPTGGPYEALAEASWQLPVAGVRMARGGEKSHPPRRMPAVGIRCIDDALDSAIPGVPG